MFLGTNALFLVPLGYKLQKDLIDDACLTVYTIICNVFVEVKSKIPRYTDCTK